MNKTILKQARKDYHNNLERYKTLLENFYNNSKLQYSAFQFLGEDEKRRFLSIIEDMVLKSTFLSTFQNTNESSFMVFIDNIIRVNKNIDDVQFELISCDLDQMKENGLPNGLKVYSLFCNLLTNEPVLVGEEEYQDFYFNHELIFLPNDEKNKAKSYFFNSLTSEKITKGEMTDSFNRLQLYYFKQLLEASQERAASRIRRLNNEEGLTTICLKK